MYTIISEHFFDNYQSANAIFKEDFFITDSGDRSVCSDVVDEWHKVTDFKNDKYNNWAYVWNTGIKYFDTVLKTYNLKAEEFRDIFIYTNSSLWELSNPFGNTRINTDLHLDRFDGFSKMINIQVYMGSENTPPEAGTSFWKYTGNNISEDTCDPHQCAAKFPSEQHNFELQDTLPFVSNLAFMYDSANEWHQAPSNEYLLKQEVPDFKRDVLIYRYRFK